MPSTNAPRIIATTAGNVSLETEIIDRQRRRRGIPIVEIRVTILPGTVKAPNILFKLALQESYAAATNYLNVQPHTATDTVRMLIKHDDLISHNHMWSSSTHVIGNDEALQVVYGVEYFAPSRWCIHLYRLKSFKKWRGPSAVSFPCRGLHIMVNSMDQAKQPPREWEGVDA